MKENKLAQENKIKSQVVIMLTSLINNKNLKTALYIFVTLFVAVNFLLILGKNNEIRSKSDEILKLTNQISEKDNFYSKYAHVIESKDIAIEQLKNQNEKHMEAYNNLNNDLFESKIISRSQLLELFGEEVNTIAKSFLDYQNEFQSLLNQFNYIEENIGPKIDTYGDYVQGTLVVADAFFPALYLDTIADGIDLSREYIDRINVKIYEINDIKESMEKVKFLSENFNENKNEETLFEASSEINEVLLVKMNDLIIFCDELAVMCDKCIDALKSARDAKIYIENKTNSGISKLSSFFFSSDNYNNQNNNIDSADKDSIESLISNFSHKTESIKTSSKDLSFNFTRDKNSFNRLMSYINIIELIDNRANLPKSHPGLQLPEPVPELQVRSMVWTRASTIE
jgi:hypothetical protein